MPELPAIPEPPLKKRQSLFRSPVAPVLGLLMSWAYRLWCATFRYELIGYNLLKKHSDEKQPVVVAIWHNEIFPLMYCRGELRLAAMVSQSKDGEILSLVLQRLGIRSIRGSSSRGGVRALIGAKKAMQENKELVCVTVDGPRGPRHVAKDGAIYLAQMADAPIMPTRIYIPKAKVFQRAWDSFRLPAPFSRVCCVFGAPYRVSPDNLSPEELALERERIFAKMTELLPGNRPPDQATAARLIPGAEISRGVRKTCFTRRGSRQRLAGLGEGLKAAGLDCIFYLLGGAISRLGVDWARRLGNCMGAGMWVFMPKRRQLAIANIQERLEVAADEAQRIARASFKHTARSFLELFLVGSFDKLWQEGRVSLDSPERYAELAQTQTPVVAATAHLGAWELEAGILGHIRPPGLGHIVVRRQRNQRVNAHIKKQREGNGATIIEHRNATRQVLRALRKPGSLAAFLVDHNCNRREAIFLPFLNELAAVNAGPAILAVRAKALLWPVYLIRVGKKLENYRFIIEEPLAIADDLKDYNHQAAAAKVAEYYTRSVEGMVRRYPEQWLWMHNRWKTRPADE